MSPRHFSHRWRKEQNNGWTFAHSDKELWQIIFLKIKYILFFNKRKNKWN